MFSQKYPDAALRTPSTATTMVERMKLSSEAEIKTPEDLVSIPIRRSPGLRFGLGTTMHYQASLEQDGFETRGYTLTRGCP